MFHTVRTGLWKTWKVMEFYNIFSRPLKVLEKLALYYKVLESYGKICWRWLIVIPEKNQQIMNGPLPVVASGQFFYYELSLIVNHMISIPTNPRRLRSSLVYISIRKHVLSPSLWRHLYMGYKKSAWCDPTWDQTIPGRVVPDFFRTNITSACCDVNTVFLVVTSTLWISRVIVDKFLFSTQMLLKPNCLLSL